MSEYTVYFGTYSDRETPVGRSRGIYVYKMDAQTGALSFDSSEDDGFNPTYLALPVDGRFLYAADETGAAAQVSAYAIDPLSKRPRFINRRDFPGNGMCNINISDDGRHLFCANYLGGNVLSVRVNADGSVGELASNIAHRGSSVDVVRQTKPYAHCAMPDRANRFLIACDLGTDRLYAYGIDADSGALRPGHVTTVPAGEGPRHIVFDRAGARAFLVTELGNNVIRYDYDPKTGALIQRQIISALAAGCSCECNAADIHLSPDERRLYASVRDISGQGGDGIACYTMEGGALKSDGFIKTKRIPRGFEVSPDGRFLVVCCQDDHCVQVFEAESRRLAFEAQLPLPVCAKFGV